MITLYTPEKAIRVTGGKILLLSEAIVRLKGSLQWENLSGGTPFGRHRGHRFYPYTGLFLKK